ncbi:MAG: hypothetical protein RR540_07045 [Oscillospiraceae bacterium]
MNINFGSSQMNFASITNVRQSAKQSWDMQNVQKKMAERNNALNNSYKPNTDKVEITDKPVVDKENGIPADVAAKLKDIAKKDFIENNGLSGNSKERIQVQVDYMKTLPQSKRGDALLSMGKILSNEGQRLATKIKEKNPNWSYGQAFDPKILDEKAKTSKTLDVRA